MSTSKEKNLQEAKQTLNLLKSVLNLPKKISENTISIYRKAWDKKLVKRTTTESMIVACLYYTVKTERMPITIEEITSKVMYLDKKDALSAYKLLLRELNLPKKNISARDYLSKMSEELNISLLIENAARKIINDVEKKGIGIGKNPRSLCASSIYIVCKMEKIDIKQKKIASIAQITEATLRTTTNEILKELDIKIEK